MASRRAPPSLASTTTRTRPANQPLAQRLLFPGTDPPPLFASPELTDEVYDVIALGLRAFVIPWWSKISRYDKEFLPDITRIVAGVVRAVDARVECTDLSLLLLCHVPAIVTQHYRDHRSAAAKLATSYASGGAASLPQLFHQLQPHMALSPDGRIDTDYFRQVVDHVLKVCLPDDDYQPDAERFIVREIIINVVLNDIIPKVTQPWFIQRALLDLLEQHAPPPEPPPSSSTSFSFHTLAVLILSAIQTISGACLALIQAYKQTLNTIKRVNKLQPKEHVQPTDHIYPMSSPTASSSTASSSTASSSTTSAPPPLLPGNYASPPLAMIAEVFTFHDRLASTVLLTTTHIITTLSTSFLDRFVRTLPFSLPFH
jgi:hypothetical protein